LERDGSGI
nr:Chain B, Serine acetyl transferase derived octapeptide [Leishmania donovani]